MGMSCFDMAIVIGQSREPVPPASKIPRTEEAKQSSSFAYTHRLCRF